MRILALILTLLFITTAYSETVYDHAGKMLLLNEYVKATERGDRTTQLQAVWLLSDGKYRHPTHPSSYSQRRTQRYNRIRATRPVRQYTHHTGHYHQPVVCHRQPTITIVIVNGKATYIVR